MFFKEYVFYLLSLKTTLWQPVSAEYIKAEADVHLFVPANSSQAVTDLLQSHAISYEYVFFLITTFKCSTKALMTLTESL